MLHEDFDNLPPQQRSEYLASLEQQIQDLSQELNTLIRYGSERQKETARKGILDLRRFEKGLTNLPEQRQTPEQHAANSALSHLLMEIQTTDEDKASGRCYIPFN